MALTKRQFLDKYIVRPLGHVRNPQEHFERRAKKVEAEIDRLPPEQRKTWKDKLAAQRTAATASDQGAAAAYHELKQVKLDARAAADQFDAAWPVTKIQDQATRFLSDATLFAQHRDAMTKRMDAVIGAVKAKTPVATLGLDQAIPALADLRASEKGWRAELVIAESERGLAVNTLDAINKYYETFMFVVTRAGSTVLTDLISKSNAALALLTGDTRSKTPTIETVKAMFTVREEEFNRELRARLATGNLQQRENDPNLAPQPEAWLAAREAEHRKTSADATVLKDRIRDETAFAQKEDKKPAPAAQVRCDMGPLFDKLRAPQGGPVDCGAVRANATADAKTFVEGLKPGSDELFDLLLKSQQDLQSEFAAHYGVAQPLNEADSLRAETAAAAILAQVRASAPDRMQDNGASMTFGGKLYKKVGPLGQGGNGTVELFQCDDGTRVAVKAIKPELVGGEDAPDFVQELRAHRQATGPDGKRNPNVLGLEGVCVDADGTVHAVLEYAPGGDAQDLGESLLAATDEGLIPEAARQALVQRMLAQAVDGLAQVHASNLAHFDIKERNFLIGADGTVKVCDFGTAVTGDADGKIDAVPSAVTPLYGAPEVHDGADGKADTYSLGVMLANLSGPAMANDLSGAAKRAPVAQPVTALDRLRNAMLDPDPAKRPSLEAVKKSTYLAQNDYLPENVEALAKQVTAYAAAFGALRAHVKVDIAMSDEARKYLQHRVDVTLDTDMSLKAMQRQLLSWNALLQRVATELLSGKDFAGMDIAPTRRRDLEAVSAALKSMIAALQGQFEAAQNTAELKSLKAKLQEAAAPFGPARPRKPKYDGRVMPVDDVQAFTQPTYEELSKLLSE